MLRPEANDCQYLFLGGILGEVLSLPFVGNYLKINRKIVRDLGVEHIECLTLNSYKSAIDNSQTLVRVIEQLHKKHEKPLVIVGHSKGSLEIILGMMDHLPIFKEKVKKVICVQPPFQGSSVVGKLNFLKYANPLWPGLKCLEANHYSEMFAEKLITNPEAQSYMRDHLLVIRGHKSRSRNVSWIIRPSHFMLKRSGHSSDGLVTLKDQIIPFAEYQEVVMDIDHSDIFTSTLLSNRNDDFRKEIMSNLINWVIDSGLPTFSDDNIVQSFVNSTTTPTHCIL
jgi:hypothetical protein